MGLLWQWFEILKRLVEHEEEVKFWRGNNRQAESAAQSLVNKACKKGSPGNISVLIVKFGQLLRADELRQGVKKKSPSWTTRLFKLIGDKKGIILSLGVVAIFYSLYHYGFLS